MEKAVKIVTALVSYFTFLSVLKADIFYSHFNVPIFELVGLDGVFNFLLEDFWPVIGCAVGLSLIFVAHFLWGRAKHRLLLSKIPFGIRVIFYAVLIAVSVLLWLCFNCRLLDIVYVFFTVVCFFIIPEIQYNYKKKGDRSVSRWLAYGVSCGVMTCIILIINTRHEISIVQEGKNIGTEIIFKGDTLKPLLSTSLNYYVGQTNDFVFYYHKNDKSVSIIPMSEIKEIHLHEVD